MICKLIKKLVCDKNDIQYNCEDAKNKLVNVNILEELAMDQHTYWKFSQSMKGRSIENVYAQYIPGEITIVEDVDKLLSFVNEENIARCYMYGDTLSKLCFDMTNSKFISIAECEYRYIGGGLGEYESKKLVVEENYSMKDIDTIVILIKLMKNYRALTSFYNNPIGDNLEQQLRKYGYFESADFIYYLEHKYSASNRDGATIVMNNIDSIKEGYIKKEIENKGMQFGVCLVVGILLGVIKCYRVLVFDNTFFIFGIMYIKTR